MKFISLICNCILFQGICLGQSYIEIRDNHTNLGVEGAHIRFVTSIDTTYTITDKSGISEANTKDIKSILVSHIAYQPLHITTEKTNPQALFFLTPLKSNLDEVVVTGQSCPTMASKAVRVVRVIDAQRIESQAAVNLKELLTNDLNFTISEDAILGSQISLQGLSGNKVKILVDGVPVLGRLGGNIDLNQINLNDIERVEVVEGPMAVQYGTDAVAGAINLITKRKAVAKPKINLNAYYESVGRYNFDGDISFPVGKWQGKVGLGRYYFDGYDSSTEARDLQWNPKEQYFATAGLQRRFDKLLLRYRGEYFNEQIINLGAIGSIDSTIVQVDTGAWKYPRGLDDYYRTTRFNNSIFFDYYPKSNRTIKGFVGYNYFRRVKKTLIKNLNDGTEILFGGVDAQDTSVFATLSSRMTFQHDWKPSKFGYQVGYDFSYEENVGQRITGGQKSITDAALFLSVEYNPWKALKIQPGLRYGYNSQFGAPLIASLATRLQLNTNWILRASYAQGFRSPTLKELHFDFVDVNHNIQGNEDLKAEDSDNFQLSLNYRKQAKRMFFEASLSSFFNNLKNEIRLLSVVEPSNEDPRGMFRNENIARTQTTGATLNFKFVLDQLEIEPGLSYIGLKNELAFDQSAEKNELNTFRFYPQGRVNVNYNFRKIGLKPALFLNYTGERENLVLQSNGEFAVNSFEAFTMSDFTLSKSFFVKKLNCSIGIKNIFDRREIRTSQTSGGGTHSASTSAIPLSYGRTYFLRIQMTLQ